MSFCASDRPHRVTSRVIPNPKDWADEGLLIPHECVRRMLETAEKMVDSPTWEQNAGKKGDWQMEKFHQWYAEDFYPFIHHHHRVEEDIYFPWVASKAGPAPETITNDHEALFRDMDAIKELRELRALRSAVHQLVFDMNEHLDAEERWLPEVLRTYFTQEEEAEIVATKIMPSVGLDVHAKINPLAIDAMIEWKGLQGTRAFWYKALPFPIRILHNWFWYPAHKARQANCVEPIISGKKPVQGCFSAALRRVVGNFTKAKA